jgi:hypothetical protein
MDRVVIFAIVSGLAGALAFACSASPGRPQPTPPQAAATPQAPPEPAAPQPPPVVEADAGDATVEAEPPPDAGPAACPDGMKLIEGDYCTEVDQKCLVEWFAPQNKKRVCEQFETSTKCVGERVRKRFCIDTYSWPNQAGVRPEVMNNFYQAQVKCAAAGKRMCTESEWTFACEGPEMKPFPYGYVRDPRKCNGDHQWDGPSMTKVAKRDATELARLWRGVPSGSQPNCISDFGVHDLPGNNDEVVASEKQGAQFSSVHTGGPWYSGVRNQCRPKVYTHDEGFYYYFLGFRCCSEPDGKPNETRTPKQVRERMRWEVVERLARFTVPQMQEKLELKKQGKCTCPDRDILCKTMCGTLLGPNAVDGNDSTRIFNVSRDKIR